MKPTERIALWAVTVLTAVGLLAFGLVVAAELAQLNRSLAALASQSSSSPRATPTPSGLLDGPSQGTDAADVDVEVTDLYILTDTVALTVTVQAYGAGDLLFEPPILTDGTQALSIVEASLEEARWAFLDLVTQGTASASLQFAGSLPLTDTLWLVFNPSQDPGNVVAPPLSVELELEYEAAGEQAGDS